MERRRETVVIEEPETNYEHARYALEGLKMAVGSSAVLAWRGAKAAYVTISGAIKKIRGKKDGTAEGAA